MQVAQPFQSSGSTFSGVGYLILGIAVFSIQDLVLKLLSGSYPLYEAMIFRSLTALPILFVLVWLNGGPRTLITPRLPRVIARAFIIFAAYFSYYLALAALPVATTVALYFTAPLFITLLSVTMLKERVGPHRWAAVIAGFAGVIIMLRPGSDIFEWAALLAVFSGLAYGLSMITARQLGVTETAAALAFWGNLVFLAISLALAVLFGRGDFANEGHASLGFLMRGWVSPTPRDLMAMMGCGVIAAFGLTLLTQAYRIAESNIVAPFEYSAIIWGVLLGWIFWQDWPDALGWLGISVIIGAGIYVLYREGVRGQPPGLARPGTDIAP